MAKRASVSEENASALRGAFRALNMTAGAFASLLDRNKKTVQYWTEGRWGIPRPQQFHIVERIASVNSEVAAQLAQWFGLTLPEVPRPAPAAPPSPTVAPIDHSFAIVSALFAACERLDARPSALRAAFAGFLSRARHESWTLDEIAGAIDKLGREIDET